MHKEEIATSDTPINGYRKISDHPLVYGFDSKEKLVEYRYKEDGLYIKEGDFFRMKCAPWSIAIYDHQSFYVDSSTIFQPSIFSGTLDGKPFVGLGSYDRLCIKGESADFTNVPLGYTTSYM